MTAASAIYLNGATLMSTPTDRVLTIALEAGYAGIEARAERLLSDPDEVRGTAVAARPGLIFSLNGVSLSLQRDGRLDRAVLTTDLRPRLAFCQEIGIDYLLAVAPRMPGLRTREAMQGLRDGLQLIADGAGRSGIHVAFEFLGFPDCPVNTPALAGEVVDPLPEVEVVLDSCHWHASGGGALNDYPVERLALVHLNDAPAMPLSDIEDDDRVLPGEGVIALSGLIADLRARGYSGPWSLETFNRSYWAEDPSDVAGRGLAAVERFLQ